MATQAKASILRSHNLVPRGLARGQGPARAGGIAVGETGHVGLNLGALMKLVNRPGRPDSQDARLSPAAVRHESDSDLATGASIGINRGHLLAERGARA
jgi:hypothetical protein